jgi:hypothetical protein
MNKKLDKFADIEGLTAEDLAAVTGGRVGAAVAMDIKKRYERQDRDRDRDARRDRDRDRDRE